MYVHDANVHALLTLEGGVAINYFGTWSGGWNEPGFEWRTDCEDGVIIQQELFSELNYARKSDKQLTPIPLQPAEAFYDDTAQLLSDFIRSLREGGPLPCPALDHLRTLALCFAGIESSETGHAVGMRQFYKDNGLTRLL
jgi:predicted dehydrogenase